MLVLKLRLRRVLRLFLILVLCFVLVQCTSSEGESSSSSANSPSSENSGISSDQISELTFSGGSSATISLDDLDGGDDFTLILYNHSESGNRQAFQISPSVSNESLSAAFLNLENHEEEVDSTESFHEFLRLEEDDLDLNALLPDSDYQNQQSYLSLGNEKTFKVLSSFSDTSSYTTVTAELRVFNQDVKFYVDLEAEDSLTDAELSELLDEFTESLDDMEEMAGEWSDVNGDQAITVLFTPEVNGYSMSGVTTGFFYAADLFDSDTYPVSNEMEIFYTFVPDPTGEHGPKISKSFAMSNIYPSVFPHELHHMISYYQKVFVHDGYSESAWLSEGISHLFEGIHSTNGDGFMTGVGLENASRSLRYLNDVENVCFTCGTTLAQRGGSFLFVRYLYEQAENQQFSGISSGKQLLQELIQTSLNDRENVEAVTGVSFESLLRDFAIALRLSNTGIISDDRYNFNGLNINATQNDNRGTVLSGPNRVTLANPEYTDALSGSGMTFIEFDAELVDDAGGALELQFSDSDNYSGVLIKQ